MEHRKEVWAVLLIVSGVAIFLVYTAARTVGEIVSFASGQSAAVAVDESGWQTYTNDTYYFSVDYPPSWQLSVADPSNVGPVAEIGNPIDGTSTYTINILVASNSDELSSGQYVHQFLQMAMSEDAANASSGPAPQLTPQFTKSFVTTVGGQDAYELFDVFEYDHSAERIYVADGSFVLIFDFPMPQQNPNINVPVNNNTVAHEIVNTLRFE